MSFHEGKEGIKRRGNKGRWVGENSQAAPLLTLIPLAFTDRAIGVVALIEGLYYCMRVF